MVEHELDCDGRRLQQYTYIQLLRWPVPFHRILHFIFISGFLFICFSIFICSFSFFSQMRKKKSKKKRRDGTRMSKLGEREMGGSYWDSTFRAYWPLQQPIKRVIWTSRPPAGCCPCWRSRENISYTDSNRLLFFSFFFHVVVVVGKEIKYKRCGLSLETNQPFDSRQIFLSIVCAVNTKYPCAVLVT